MANTSSLVTFLAQDTQQPLPAGLTVTIYPQGATQTPGNIVATGTLGSNGTAPLSLAFGTNYTAVFTGPGAPSYTYNFSLGSGQFVVGPFATVSDQQNTSNGFLGIETVNASGSPVKTLIQWMEVQVQVGSDGTGSASATFPQAFANAVFRVIPDVDDGASYSGYAMGARALARTPQGFTAYVFSGPPNSTVNVGFTAIGY